MEPNSPFHPFADEEVTLPMITVFKRDESDDETMPTFSFGAPSSFPDEKV